MPYGASSISTKQEGWSQRSGRGHQRRWSWSRVPPCGVLSEVRGTTGRRNVLDAEQSIIFGNALTTSRSTSLDLTSAEGNDEVSDDGVFSFTRSVRNHDAPTIRLRQLSTMGTPFSSRSHFSDGWKPTPGWTQRWSRSG